MATDFFPARKVVLTMFMSLDGVIQEPSDWGGPYHSEDAGGFKHAELFESGVLLLGRVTYQGFVEYWPGMQGTGDFADRMNSPGATYVECYSFQVTTCRVLCTR